jgi:hypothetical protein
MKASELLELWKDEIVDFEIYQLFSEYNGFHTDNLKNYYVLADGRVYDENIVEKSDLLDNEVMQYAIVDENDYNRTVMANSCESADFESWYNDKNAKVLLIAI